MTASYLLTPSATRDLDDILSYVLENSGPERAMHVHAKLHAGFVKIGAHPKLHGHIREDLADESLRVHVVFSYLIIYRPDTKPVQVVRVIHGARDLPQAVQEDS